MAKYVDTKFGTMEIGANGIDHIYTTSNFTVATPTREMNRLHINNVAYACTAHFYRWNDGEWHLGQQKEGNEWTRVMNAFYLSKTETTKDTYPSDSARKKAIEEVTKTVQAWAKENPLMIIAAERDQYEKEASETEAKIESLEAELKAEREKLVGLKALYEAKKAVCDGR